MSGQRKMRFRVIAGVLLLAVWQIATLAVGVRFGLQGFADFRAFYGAGTIVRMDGAARLYDYAVQHQVQNARVGARTAALPFVYPGYAALPFVPLSLLGYRAAYLAWMMVNLGLLGLAAGLMLPWLGGLRRLWEPLPWLLFACFCPVAIALLQGQVSILLLVIVSACFAALERGRDALAGVALALALMKFHVVLPVVLLFLVWRRWRFVGGFVAGAAGVGAVCLAMSGVAGLREYVGQMFAAAASGSVAGVRDDSMLASPAMPDLHGIGMALAGQAPGGTVLVIVASIAVLVWTARGPVSLPRATVAGLLVSYHLHLHDLSLLLLPLGLVWDGMAREPWAGSSRDWLWTHWAMVASGVFWLASPLLTWMMGARLNWMMGLAMLPLLGDGFIAGGRGDRRGVMLES